MDGITPSAFDERELALFRAASKLVRAVKDRSVLIRCHELARAVGKMLGLKVVDGHVIGTFGIGEHSWLVTHRGNILDVYSPLRLPMVQLIYLERFPVVHLYEGGGLKLKKKVDFKIVEGLVRVMKGSLKGPLKLPPARPGVKHAGKRLPERKRSVRVRLLSSATGKREKSHDD